MSFAGPVDPRRLGSGLVTAVGCTLAFALGFGLAFTMPVRAAAPNTIDGIDLKAVRAGAAFRAASPKPFDPANLQALFVSPWTA